MYIQENKTIHLINENFFFNDTATTEIYTLFLHDALPICRSRSGRRSGTWHPRGTGAWNADKCQRAAGRAGTENGYCSTRLSGLISGRRGVVRLAWRHGERGHQRLVPVRCRPRGCPHPLAVRPEPEQRAKHDADVVRDEVRQLAGLAEAVGGESDDRPLDHQPDAVEREEHHGLARHGGALAVPEAPVPVGDVAGDRRHDDRDGGRGQRTQVEVEMQPAVDEVVDDDTDRADDAQLGALVDEQPESLVEPSHTAHRGGPPFDRTTPRSYPHRRTSKHCRQDYRLSRHPERRARIPHVGVAPGSRPVIQSVLSAAAGRVADVAHPDILIRARRLTKKF